MTTFSIPQPLRATATLITILIGLLVYQAVSVCAAAPPEGPPPIESAPKSARDSAPMSKHWLRKLADVMTGHETDNGFARSHVSVRNAFRATVAQPAKCMAEIWCGNQQVALATIIDPDGLLVTKASELTGDIACELSNGTRYQAQLVSVDRGSDLALLKISERDLPAIEWSEDDPPSVGGWVVTPGVGELPLAVGIVSVAPHHVRGGVLGIQMTEDRPGPRITFVVPGSGAAIAGLAPGDIITHVNGKPMASSNDMVATTSSMLPGEKIQLSIIRLDERKQVTATLGSVSDTLSSRRARFQDRLGSPLSRRRFLFPSALEHDSTLAPNQCGGVLVDLDGKAIGVNIARASRISSYAIPARIARSILESLKARAAQPEAAPPVTHLLKPELTGVAVEQ